MLLDLEGNGTEQEFSNMEDRDCNENWAEHKERVSQLLIQGFKGMIGGLLFIFIMMGLTSGFGGDTKPIADPSILLLAIITGLFCAGFPYGWSLINRTVGDWSIFGNLIVVLAFFWFKAGLSLILGITVYPIVLMYNLIHSQKSKRRIRITWSVIAASMILFFVLLGQLTAWEAQNYPERYSGSYGETEMTTGTEKAVNAQTFAENPAMLDDEITRSLTNTQKNEKEYTDTYGWPVLQQTQLHGVFFLESKNPDNPHRNIMKELNVSNAIAVVTGYFLEEGGDFVVNEWEMDAWIYPNYSFNRDGFLTYDAQNVYCDNLRTSDMEEIIDWFSSEYADMYVTELDIPET